MPTARRPQAGSSCLRAAWTINPRALSAGRAKPATPVGSGSGSAVDRTVGAGTALDRVDPRSHQVGSLRVDDVAGDFWHAPVGRIGAAHSDDDGRMQRVAGNEIGRSESLLRGGIAEGQGLKRDLVTQVDGLEIAFGPLAKLPMGRNGR